MLDFIIKVSPYFLMKVKSPFSSIVVVTYYLSFCIEILKKKKESFHHHMNTEKSFSTKFQEKKQEKRGLGFEYKLSCKVPNLVTEFM